MPWMDCICCVRNICYGLNGKEAMLAHCRGKQACNHEVAGGSTTPMMVQIFTPWEVAINLLFHSFNATEGQDGLSFSYLLTTFSKVVWFALYKRTLSGVQLKIITLIMTQHNFNPASL